MYPLKTFLVGCQESALANLRRELANLSVPLGGEYRDVRGALAALGGVPADGSLFILQPTSAEEVGLLERLSDAFAGQPILAVVDPGEDPTLMVRAMRAGAAQVVRLPLRPEDFKAAMHRIAVQFGHPPLRSKVVAVLGATEGCGATTIAINLSAEIARLQRARCILAEGAVALGQLASHLAIEPQLTSYDLLRDPERLDVNLVRQALTPVGEHFSVLVGPYRAISPLAVTARDTVRVINYLRQLAEVVVLDLPCSFTSDCFELLAAAQQVVLVALQSVPSVSALKLLIEKLAADSYQGAQSVVLNRYDPSLEGLTSRRLGKVVGVAEVLTVAEDHEAVLGAENNGKALYREAPRSRALADIDVLARKVQGLVPPPPPWRPLTAILACLPNWFRKKRPGPQLAAGSSP